MAYENFKMRLDQQKPKIILGACFVLVFLIGFGTGRFQKQTTPSKINTQPYYTPPSAQKPVSKEENKEAVPVKAAAASDNCIVKGNISAAGKKIFHVMGGAFYKQVKPEQCFNTEAEAVSAGFVKSSR